MAGLFEYLGGAAKRKEQIDKTLQEGTTPSVSTSAPSLRTGQPAPKKKKKPWVAPRKPIDVRPDYYPTWLKKRKAEYDAQ